MKLEKEIIQSAKFISEYHKLAVNIMFTSGWLMRRHAEQLKPMESLRINSTYYVSFADNILPR